mmetsp:Transcript_11425/g.22429  ORF Transcript_11425/g.22429 Transcript_11425/m.22429 type:complete len:1010 (-) Transcript_11425:128-3157(-)|eukprot:CAMPEP_0171561134 /NCGR_PEP_ID=MMETSP0960-20121227/14131_1 /TAXON_ID=87120 /ORGANISM="Aurantiochytrium limacinum, Strain ATCCMYA-1381" /LENGTH=1009 /DNA_ID=CAMNT_0012113507 /DNA_START=94 /DNA_END=3123 /DNA_ORIENTATION=-
MESDAVRIEVGGRPSQFSSAWESTPRGSSSSANNSAVRANNQRRRGRANANNGTWKFMSSRNTPIFLALLMMIIWTFGGWMLFMSLGCEFFGGEDATSGPLARRSKSLQAMELENELEHARSKIISANEALLQRLRSEALVEARSQVAEELSEANAKAKRLENQVKAATQKAEAASVAAAKAEAAAAVQAATQAATANQDTALVSDFLMAERLDSETTTPATPKPTKVHQPTKQDTEESTGGITDILLREVREQQGDVVPKEVVPKDDFNAVQWVDVLRGTDNKNWRSLSRGNALPIISRPFGMTHWALTNVAGGEPWFFNPSRSNFAGIRCTHQPSPWIGDYGFFDVRPYYQRQLNTRAAKYNTGNAIFHPHHMVVSLTSECRSGSDCIKVELTPSERSAIFRIEYPPGGENGVQFAELKSLAVENEDGQTQVIRFSGHSRSKSVFDPPALMKHYAYIEVMAEDSRPLRFDANSGQVTWDANPSSRTIIHIRVGTSFINAKQAKLSMHRELGSTSGFDPSQFIRVREEGFNRWNNLLGRVRVTADSKEELENVQETLYSCLYRGLLFPRPLGEIDENGKLRHWSPFDMIHFYDGPIYTDSGFWDAYRAQYPMLHLIYPDLVVDIMEGWVNAIREDPSKMLTQWASPGRVGSMEGSMGEVSLAEAMINGALVGESADVAMDYIKRSATDTQVKNGRAHLADYDRYGYVPYVVRRDGTVSVSLNYYLSDAVDAMLAKSRGDTSLAKKLEDRSRQWRKLFDPSTKFFRPKRTDGTFVPNFNEHSWMGPYTEGGPWQYRFYVPHDPKGLRQAYEDAEPALPGQPSRLCQVLLDAMTRTGRVSNPDKIHEMLEMLQHSFGEYAHNNQPVHHVLYMFAHAGCPLDGQRYIHHTLRTQYGDFGYAGDEDNGEMSSWFVLSSLGLYSLVPGSGKYQVGAPPLYRTVTIHRPQSDPRGRRLGTLKIRREVPATTSPLKSFIPSTRVRWNGNVMSIDADAVTIPYADLLAGGDLVFLA